MEKLKVAIRLNMVIHRDFLVDQVHGWKKSPEQVATEIVTSAAHEQITALAKKIKTFTS